ncbi:MAG: hypothetical protein K2K87_10115 [Lachnospiraceae bacterium]|nr:hypothetical protein [Lachnospiraceae bacterium]
MDEQAREQPVMWNASKFQIPKEAQWRLQREKLLAGIENGDESAVVFHAGAGYGKTTAMAEWARSHRARSCWYRLHESDNQFDRFLCGIATAISGIVKAELWDAEIMRLIGCEGPERVSECFFSRCIPALPADGFFICLDDFQVIHDETVQDFLLRFMEYGEGRARFFFALRGGFPGFLAACLMRGAAREVKADELRFEEWETALLLQKMAGRELPEQVARDIHADMRGWPAGVVFAGMDLKEVRMQPTTGAELFDRTHLYDYIFYEIFRNLSNDTQQFLLESSVLETMRPSVCDHAMGRKDAADMFRYLMRENLFLSRMEGKEEMYCYDSFFRGFLRSRLSAGRRMEILLKVAAYEELCGRGETAEEKKNAARELENAAREKHAPLFVQCFGALSVRGQEGEVVWRTKKTKELFACLFYEHGRWVTRDVLTERLWPEKPAQNAAVLFHTTTSYLRRALAAAGTVECLLVKNQSYALDMTRVRSDIEELDDCYACLKSGNTLTNERADQFVALYRQGYLYEEDYLWLGAYREEVEQRYLWVLKTLSDRAFAEKQYAEAAAYLKKAVEVDGYALAAMERLVECLILCRNIAGARKVYKRFQDASLEVLGEAPAREFKEYLGKG